MSSKDNTVDETGGNVENFGEKVESYGTASDNSGSEENEEGVETYMFGSRATSFEELIETLSDEALKTHKEIKKVEEAEFNKRKRKRFPYRKEIEEREKKRELLAGDKALIDQPTVIEIKENQQDNKENQHDNKDQQEQEEQEEQEQEEAKATQILDSYDGSIKLLKGTEKLKEKFRPLLSLFDVEPSGNIFKDFGRLSEKLEDVNFFLDKIFSKIFELYDDDNNGYVDKDELKLLLQDVGEATGDKDLLYLTDDRLNMIMNDIDDDGNGKIEKEELCGYLIHWVNHTEGGDDYEIEEEEETPYEEEKRIREREQRIRENEQRRTPLTKEEKKLQQKKKEQELFLALREMEVRGLQKEVFRLESLIDEENEKQDKKK